MNRNKMPKKNESREHTPVEVSIHLETWGRMIASQRKREKTTHAALGERLGVSQPTVSRMEKGDPAVAVGTYLSAIYALSLQADLIPFPQQEGI